MDINKLHPSGRRSFLYVKRKEFMLLAAEERQTWLDAAKAKHSAEEIKDAGVHHELAMRLYIESLPEPVNS
jgi:hypothetical protein